MRKFLIKIFILLVIVGGCCGLISAFDYFIIGSQYEYNYQASLIDKVDRLESINEPKIILVGHSNLSFGIDSKMLEEATGMPVVNLGLHGGLGNAFHEEIAKLNINEGDIVIVCHSSFSDTDTISDTALAWITVDKNKELWKIIRNKDYPSMLKAYPDYLKNDFFLWITHKGNIDAGGCYSRNAFNEYGDVVYKPEDGQMDVEEFFKDTDTNNIVVPQIGDVCVNRLNEYNKFITDRGATMLIAGYPIAYGEYASFGKKDFEEFKKELQDRLDCEIISDYTDYFYPYDYFYNTTLHLTKEGAEIRTAQLISDIERWKSEEK